MHPSEASRSADCAACGQHITVSGDRVFAFGKESVLCYDCGVARGGLHDDNHDRWTAPPNVEDLLSLEREL